MRISPVNYNSYKNSFKRLDIKPSAEKSLKHLSKDELNQIKSWGKDLNSLKHFDLVVSGFRDSNDLLITFEHKQNPWIFDSVAPLLPIKLEGKRLHARAIDLIDSRDSINYSLKFPSEDRAQEVCDKLSYHASNCEEDNPFKQIAWAVDGVKALEEGFSQNT